MPAIITLMVGVMLLSVESVLLWKLDIANYCVQSAIIFTIYLAMRRKFSTGAWILCAMFIPVEWLVVGRTGYYSLGLVVVFLTAHIVKSMFRSNWGFGHVVLAALMTWLHGLTMIIAMMVFTTESHIWQSIATSLWSAPLGVAIATWPVGYFLEKCDRIFSPQKGKQLFYT